MMAAQVTQAGTFNWAAPELILNHEVTCAADVYSFGIILFEIITGEVPTRGVVRMDRLWRVGCALMPTAARRLLTG